MVVEGAAEDRQEKRNCSRLFAAALLFWGLMIGITVEEECDRYRRRRALRYVHYQSFSCGCVCVPVETDYRNQVSQFTLLAKTKKGSKPDFHGAANPDEASRLYQYFVNKVKSSYVDDRVKDGKFQAMMEVALVNDGPVSVIFPCLVNFPEADSRTTY